MPDTPELEMSDDIFKSLIDATHSSFILLAMRRLSRPIDVQDVVNILSLKEEQACKLLDTLLHFGFINPVGDSQLYTITQSGIEMVSSNPASSPFQYDPSCEIEGDRLPTNIAFDLLPLRLYTYRLSQGSDDKEH